MKSPQQANIPEWTAPKLDHIGSLSDVAGRPVPVGPQAASRNKS
ncbi:hypothetical protein [Pontixanthobacter gangjinensis]|nr:hypothetical protein [Pontixanthobacter gangjinensis]